MASCDGGSHTRRSTRDGSNRPPLNTFKALDQGMDDEQYYANRGTERGSACTPLLAQDSAQSWKNNYSSGHFRESDQRLPSPPNNEPID